MKTNMHAFADKPLATDTATGVEHHSARTIVPRMDLDFQLDDEIPRYWFGGDPFLSRLFDALSVIFPNGERYFIACVRDFRDQIGDPKLQQDVKDFTRQEGQHGQAHERFNQHLRAQGVKIDAMQAAQSRLLFEIFRRRLPKRYTLAMTAAAEHLTATLAQSFTARYEVMSRMHPNMLALLAWHAMEEVEHKAVAFDVMRDVAGVGYALRVLALVQISIEFPAATVYIASKMLKVDGYDRASRARIIFQGLRRELKPDGLLGAIKDHYLSYYKPGFHPNQLNDARGYDVWLKAWNRTGDAMEASRELLAAAA
jgi:predicted metal-dependent hydrolase